MRFALAPMTAVALACSFAVSSWALQQAARPTTSVALAPPTMPPGLADLDRDVDARVGALVELFARKGPFNGVVVVAREGEKTAILRAP